jgi:hypothetical protein
VWKQGNVGLERRLEIFENHYRGIHVCTSSNKGQRHTSEAYWASRAGAYKKKHIEHRHKSEVISAASEQFIRGDQKKGEIRAGVCRAPANAGLELE